jgi:prepilin-type N-terminal cleavage/methylation domain-containing protein
MNKNNDGFTLIELLIVIGILSVLASIAIPALLGQREKAKIAVFTTSAKNLSNEIVSVLDDYRNRLPILIKSSRIDTVTCYEYINIASKYNCFSVYPDITDVQTYNDLGALLDTYADYRNNILKEKSPFGPDPLIARDAVSNGRISILNSADNIVTITATGMSGVAIFEENIKLR